MNILKRPFRRRIYRWGILWHKSINLHWDHRVCGFLLTSLHKIIQRQFRCKNLSTYGKKKYLETWFIEQTLKIVCSSCVELAGRKILIYSVWVSCLQVSPQFAKSFNSILYYIIWNIWNFFNNSIKFLQTSTNTKSYRKHMVKFQSNEITINSKSYFHIS